MVLLQAVIGSTDGPAVACLRLVDEGRVRLLLSAATLSEVTDVLSRSKLRQRFPELTLEVTSQFLDGLVASAEFLPHPPGAFSLPRDPDDEIYTDLAVAGGAQYLVSWNERHLNYLMKRDTPEGENFCARHPQLKVVTPVEFLGEMARVP